MDDKQLILPTVFMAVFAILIGMMLSMLFGVGILFSALVAGTITVIFRLVIKRLSNL